MQNYIKRIKQNNDHTRIVRKIPFPSSYKIWRLNHIAQKMIWIWPHFLQKWVMEKFSFCAVSCIQLIDWYNSWPYSFNPIFSQCSHFIYLLKTLRCQDIGIVISLRKIRGQLIIRKMCSSPSELVIFFQKKWDDPQQRKTPSKSIYSDFERFCLMINIPMTHSHWMDFCNDAGLFSCW